MDFERFLPSDLALGAAGSTADDDYHASRGPARRPLRRFSSVPVGHPRLPDDVYDDFPASMDAAPRAVSHARLESSTVGMLLAELDELQHERSRLVRTIAEQQQAVDLAEQVANRALAERDAVLSDALEKEAAQAMLADSLDYVKLLRHKVAQLEELLLAEWATRGAEAAQRPPERSHEQDSFGLEHTREAIEKAVREAATLPESERRKKLNALRLQWHPDKHHVLKDMANEVRLRACPSPLVGRTIFDRALTRPCCVTYHARLSDCARTPCVCTTTAHILAGHKDDQRCNRAARPS